MRKSLLTCTILLVVVFIFNFGRSDSSKLGQNRLELLRAKLADVSLRSDESGVLSTIDELKDFLAQEGNAAEVNYLVGFGYWQLLHITFGNLPGGDTVLALAMDYLRRAQRLDSSLAESYAVHAFCAMYARRLDSASSATLFAELPGLMEKADRFGSHNPRIKLAQGMLRPANSSIWTELIEDFEAYPDYQDGQFDWWLPTAFLHVGMHYAISESPDRLLAKAALEKASDMVPEYPMLDGFGGVSMTDPVEDRHPTTLPPLQWRKVAEDSAGDGQNPAFADVNELYIAFDRASDSVWIKFSLSSLPDARKFGVNVIVDSDLDQNTGMAWWGANRDFRFDHLVTAWVVRDTGDGIWGTIGIAGSQQCGRGVFTSQAQNNLAISLDMNNSVIVIGFHLSDLQPGRTIRFICAVGSNRQWNDDIPDDGFIQVLLDTL